ncbi:hypothetical protein TMEN_9415 [Trichophyton mentagrophytes]|nr:hypothetical protein TMEN_9415 [Trichophyton mentagrophytes]
MTIMGHDNALITVKKSCIRFEKYGLEPIEVAALNAYIPHLKAYQEKGILESAYRDILNEYKSRSLQQGNSSEEQERDLVWLDSLYSDDTSGLNVVEESVLPLAGSGNDVSDTGPPTLYARYRGGGSGGPRSVNGNHLNNPSSWTNFEQRCQAVLEPRCSPHLAINDGIRPHQASSDMPGGHGIVSGWFQEHDIRDAGAAADVSQQGGEQNAAGCEQRSSQLEHRHQGSAALVERLNSPAEIGDESFSQRGAKRRRTNAARGGQTSVTRLTHGSWNVQGQERSAVGHGLAAITEQAPTGPEAVGDRGSQITNTSDCGLLALSTAANNLSGRRSNLGTQPTITSQSI